MTDFSTAEPRGSAEALLGSKGLDIWQHLQQWLPAFFSAFKLVVNLRTSLTNHLNQCPDVLGLCLQRKVYVFSSIRHLFSSNHAQLRVERNRHRLGANPHCKITFHPFELQSVLLWEMDFPYLTLCSLTLWNLEFWFAWKIKLGLIRINLILYFICSKWKRERIETTYECAKNIWDGTNKEHLQMPGQRSSPSSAEAVNYQDDPKHEMPSRNPENSESYSFSSLSALISTKFTDTQYRWAQCALIGKPSLWYTCFLMWCYEEHCFHWAPWPTFHFSNFKCTHLQAKILCHKQIIFCPLVAECCTRLSFKVVLSP